MDFESAVRYIRSFDSYEDQVTLKYDEQHFDLGKVRKFLKDFDVGYEKLNVIHVAGSKGKGSTCNLIANYLYKAGHATGLFTSPYMFDIRESFWLNGELISKADFCAYVERLKGFMGKYKGPKMTYFELLTALVFQYFVERGVDYAVVEVGIGGRLDCTNVIYPEITVLSGVELEHEGILGNTLEEIVREKLGIRKEGVPLVIGYQEEEVMDILEKELASKKDVFYLDDIVKVENVERLAGGFVADYVFDGGRFERIFLNTYSQVQLRNTALAFAVIRKLRGSVDEGFFREVLGEFCLPGRMDIRSIENKTVVLDMAHTLGSIKNLLVSLENAFLDQKFVFLFSVMKDKKVEEILELVLEKAEKIVFTQAHEKRAVSVTDLFDMARKILPENKLGYENNPKRAYEDLLKQLKQDQVLVVVGSHFLLQKLKQI